MFTNPILLWGLFFVLVPLAIHLVNLLRHRQVDWGAMEFLLAAFRKHRTRVRMKEILLLFMRMLLIVLAVLLLAAPVMRNFLPGGTGTHHVVVLDDSFSMTDRMGEGSVFENAKISIQKLLDELSRQGGAHNFTILRTSQAREGIRKADVHDQRISRNFQEIFSPKSLNPSHLSGGLPDALAYAAELVPESIEGNRIFYVISDFRSRDWQDDPTLAAQLKKLTNDGIRLRLIDCAPSEHPNLGLSALKPQEGIQAAGVPILASVQITNFGNSTAQNVVLHPEIFLVGKTEKTASTTPKTNATDSPPSVDVHSSDSADSDPADSDPADSETSDDSSLSVAQTLPAVTIAEIPAGETVAATFPLTFPVEGSYGIRVSLPPDALAEDNQAFAALFIPSFEPVLIIDDSLDASTSRFLRTALSPGDRVRTGLTPRVEKARFLSANNLNAFRSIYLLNTARLEPQAVSALEQFVRNGGGLCVFTGPNTDPINVQKWFRDGKGFFPVLLDQTEELPTYYASPDVRVAPHPIFRLFAGENSSLFNSIRVKRYFTLDDSSLERIIPLQDETALTQKSRKTAWENQTENQIANILNPSDAPNSAASDADVLGDVHVLAALRNNAPLVLERAYGKGKVVLFLTTADRTWTDWPVGDPSRPNPFTQGSYVVMALQLQAFLTQKPFFFWKTGDSLSANFGLNEFEGTVPFFHPDATLWERFTATLSHDGQQKISTPPTSEPGIFRAELKGLNHPSENRLFAVNADIREGALKKASQEELAVILKDVPFDFVSAENFRFKTEDSGRSAITDWILAFTLLWMILEMLMAANASWHLGSGESGSGKPRDGKSRAVLASLLAVAKRSDSESAKPAKKTDHGGEK